MDEALFIRLYVTNGSSCGRCFAASCDGMKTKSEKHGNYFRKNLVSGFNTHVVKVEDHFAVVSFGPS